MRYCVLVMLLLGCVDAACAQTLISGHVRNYAGEPSRNAKVYLENSYDETFTDSTGRYELQTDETGEQTIITSISGYETVKKKVQINTPTIKLDLVFVDKINMIASVIVSSNRNKILKSDDEIKSLSMMDVVTTVTDGNIFSAIKLLPGVQQVGESGELYTRGGLGSENRVYINGMQVSNYLRSTSSNQSSTSKFSSSLFDATQFYSGGYSAQFGQAMSSIVDLSLYDVASRENANVSISPIFLGGDFTLLSKGRTASVTGSAAYTNLNLYYGLLPTTNSSQFFNKAPETYEAYFKYSAKTKYSGTFNFFTNINRTALTYSNRDIDNPDKLARNDFSNNGLYSLATWKAMIKGWKINAGVSYNLNRDQISSDSLLDNSMVFHVDNQVKNDGFQEKVSLRKGIGYNDELLIGNEVITSRDNYITGRDELTLKNDLYSLFAEYKRFFGTSLAAELGLRWEYNTLVAKHNLSPRLHVIYELSKENSLSLNYGTYYQNPSNSLWLRALPVMRLNYEKSTIYNLSFQHRVPDIIIKAEAYFKQYTQLIQTVPELSNNGSGYAGGFDFFMRDKRTLKYLEYWLSYSYIDSKRKFLDYPVETTPSFVSDHTFSVVLKRYFQKLNTMVSTTYSFGTGRPYYNPGAQHFLSDRTPTYNSLNCNIIYLTKAWKAFAVIVFSVNNVLGVKQVYGYNYSILDPSKREVIGPLTKQFFFIGTFLNFGIDKRQQIIDNTR